MTARTLSDARVGHSQRELVAQKTYSSAVVAAIEGHGRWRYAPRHATCWSHVAWAKLCNQVRLRLNAHRWLARVAAERLAALYPPKPVARSVPEIICAVFGGACAKALSVARCESTLSVFATNGQYHGLFQMGSAERARFGDGWDAWSQARAAFAYYQVAGWAPWQCA